MKPGTQDVFINWTFTVRGKRQGRRPLVECTRMKKEVRRALRPLGLTVHTVSLSFHAQPPKEVKP